MFRPGGKSEWSCGVVAEHCVASEGKARPGSACGVVAKHCVASEGKVKPEWACGVVTKDCVTPRPPVPLTPITFRWVISY